MNTPRITAHRPAPIVHAAEPPEEEEQVGHVDPPPRLSEFFGFAFFWHIRVLQALGALVAIGLVTEVQARSNVVFPLRVAAGGAYLEDSRGTPFLLTGDSAWSMIADLATEDAEDYLDNRQKLGFNAILTSVIEHKFARLAPANLYGERPFIDDDFSRPNERYFARVATVLRAAEERGILVLLCPAYLGAGGGEEGWYQEMEKAGPVKLRAYGRYLGRRFRSFANILWVQGGDFDPPDRQLVEAIAEGLRETMPDALQTVHANRDTRSDRYWLNARWMSLDTVYTYADVAQATLARYHLGPRRPFFLIESLYENEHGVDEQKVRQIAYGALLSGASGQVFGNNPVWHFSAAGLFDADATWKQSLFSRGARSISHLVDIFRTLDWWRLIPDEGKLVEAVDGEGDAYGVAARAQDGSAAVIYVNNVERLRLDWSMLGNGERTVEWIDPSSGVRVAEVEGSSGLADDELLAPVGPNESKYFDWIAVVRVRR